ncbi:MAG TPA: DUF4397 domain-containing protein [Anaeromyxobacter sp.]|nr:DUF4397 domain-containing protein [Anaeromyxobacter sp.]
MNTRNLVLAFTALLFAACDSSSSSPGNIHVRVAHLSPNAPAVDFCLAKSGGSFTGPILKGLSVTSGLAYSEVTKYLELDAGQYTARLVAPDATDCATALASLPDYSLPSLSDGTYATVAAIGIVGATDATAFTVKPYVDESTVPSGKAALRFVHASPGTPAVDVGILAESTFTALFEDVAFGDYASNSGIDPNGYLVTSPISLATVSARPTGTSTDALVVEGVSLPAGAIASVFAIGELSSNATPLKVLVCVDTAAAVGALSSCSIAP